MCFGKINNPNHPHELQLEHKNEAYVCNACDEEGWGRRYSCLQPTCCTHDPFHLHKDCSNPPNTAMHRFFPDRTFKLHRTPGPKERTCNACGWDIKGMSYRCNIGNTDLHPCCAFGLKNKIVVNCFEFMLTKKISCKCEECGHKDLHGNTQSFAYVSADKEIQWHLYCIKKMLKERLEKIFLGVIDINDVGSSSGGGGGGGGGEIHDQLALVESDDEVRVSMTSEGELYKKKKRSGGMGGILKKVMEVALATIIAVFVGDPTALLISIVSSFRS